MKAVILASLLGSAAGAAVVTGTINYSSPFKLTVPIDSAFHVVPSVANIWSWTGPADGTPILVDINGDGVMDTSDPKVKVVITDVLNFSDALIYVENSSGLLLQGASARDGREGHLGLTTPCVLPTGSDLSVRTISSSGGFQPTVTLIGRVQNL